ncbi:MAG: hypothetical protein AVDCRST_MAG16-1438 [uncultured Frankineae bacterium]|uniref:Uncharacterized protein n=1 Tax=uncultured Frankineae bacterium TaxID=437475 RepID=A0A6J4LI67_9ACTN|nr:MAG: hypothetical protein AVDCRST_MAG16-1438 [uncultured Frankineae bacterium]
MYDRTSGLCLCGCGWTGAQTDRSAAAPPPAGTRPSPLVQATAHAAGPHRARRWHLPSLALPRRAPRR